MTVSKYPRVYFAARTQLVKDNYPHPFWIGLPQDCPTWHEPPYGTLDSATDESTVETDKSNSRNDKLGVVLE
jgi:hypothetical protein